MRKLLLFLIAIALLYSCSKNSTKPTTITTDELGTLDVEFVISFLVDPYPTRQTVVWLEDDQNNYIKTLYISDWLSNGGYEHDQVCSTWRATKNWTDSSQQDFDGVTGATPPTDEPNKVSFQFKGNDLQPGMYQCKIETHIIDEYNILYADTLEIKDKTVTATPAPTYIPKQHEKAKDMLNSVSMNYYFE